MFIQPAAPLPLHEASALVIEGNPQSRSILVAQLRELGLGNVVQCSRLHDARRKLEASRFDVVICEQEFDRDSSSGQELLDDLRRNQILPFYTVFIMLTAEATYSKVAEAAESALDAYLLKPHTAARLHERILQARQRKRALQDIFSAIDRQDFDTASQLCLQRFESRQPYWLYAARIGAELMLRSGAVDDAKKLYEAVIEAKTLPWARLGVARAQIEGGQPARAMSTLQALISDDDAYADAYDVMGRAQFELGQLENALSTFEMATRLTPSSITRLLKHGTLAFYAGDRGVGLEKLDRATRAGLDSKLFDPQALVLLAFARLDNNDHRGLLSCVEHMTRLRDRAFEPERPQALLDVVTALNALQHKQPQVAVDTVKRLSASVTEPAFDFESACNLLGLMARLHKAGSPPPDADIVVEALALRFGTGRSLSELLAGAARGGHDAWTTILRDGHARILKMTEDAMRMTLKGDPRATAVQLLADGTRTLNGKLLESAHQLLARYRDRIPDADELQIQVDDLRERYRARPPRLGESREVESGGVALPAGFRTPTRPGLLDEATVA